MILLIGNSGLKHHGVDGQTTKVRLYLKKIKDEGFDVRFIDLETFLKRPFSTLMKISKGIKECDRIVLITAERGCKLLIPFINSINKKYHKPFILPLVGSSVLHYTIDKMSDENAVDFLVNHNYSLGKKEERFSNQLKKINYILPETIGLTEVFSEFYGLSNCYTLTNFREFDIVEHQPNIGKQFKLIFISRVMEKKGIFDLLETVNSLKEKNIDISLDIYGNLCLSDVEKSKFNELVNKNTINYCGSISNDLVIPTISKYNLLVFPTKFVFEGVPGVIIESLLAGTPILTSNYPQAKFLLNDGYDSIFYEMFDKEDLEHKLIEIIDLKDKLITLSKNAFESGKHYTYEHERSLFLKYVCGVDE